MANAEFAMLAAVNAEMLAGRFNEEARRRDQALYAARYAIMNKSKEAFAGWTIHLALHTQPELSVEGGLALKFDGNYGEWRVFNAPAVGAVEWTDGQLFFFLWSAAALGAVFDFVDHCVDGLDNYTEQAFIEHFRRLASTPTVKSAGKT
jgi:hypothetical protein